MYTQSLLTIAAALGAVNASPLLKRQTVVATESITSVATVGTSAASTPGINPTVTAAMPSGTGTTYPLYPCASGYSLTYVQNNATIQQPIGQVKTSIGEWATASFFPNVTASMGGSTVGATHTYSALGADFMETLVNSTANSNDGSAYTQFVWNSTAPVLTGAQEISSYTSVFKAYDPNFSMLGRRSNQTFVQIFTNACAANQADARSTLQSLQSLQLGLINGTGSSNSTSNGGVYVSSVVATNTVSTTNTNTAIDTNTVLATSTNAVTQTNTLIPLTATSTGTTVQQTVTPVTVAVTSTAATVASTAATTVVTANPNTATTVVAVSTTSV